MMREAEEPILYVREDGECDEDSDELPAMVPVIRCEMSHSDTERQEQSFDDWDDTKLVKAFDIAIAKAKRQICTKLQSELKLTEAEIRQVFSDHSSGNKKRKKRHKKNKNRRGLWEIGSACRAVYSEDGEEYEAEIISFIDANWCIVKYIGYDNEEAVLLKELMPSHGGSSVEVQEKMAEVDINYKEDQDVDSEGQNNESDMPRSGASSDEADVKPTGPRLYSGRPPFFHHGPPPPPPPPLTGFGASSFHKFVNPMTGAAGHSSSQGSDSLNKMLYSWYMCGYYTGYYQRDVKDEPPANQ